MELIDKRINEALEQELMAEESDRVEDFKRKSTQRFFATISAFIDQDWYRKHNPEKNKDESWKKYCEQATIHLQNDLKRLGLEYQKVYGAWEGGEEKSFLVWNTAYTFEQFEALMLKLNENYKQWAICIGKWVGDKYEINLWITDSLDSINYKVSKQFTKVSPREAIHDNWTILTRHIFNKAGEKDKEKQKPSIAFESIERNICLAASWSQWGAHERGGLLKEYLNK